MIHKVYIVRCSYCHAPLREPYGLDHRPKYFYSIDNIQPVLKEAGWQIIHGAEVCKSCSERQRSSEL